MSVTYNSDDDTYELRGEKYRLETEAQGERTTLRITRCSDSAEVGEVDAFKAEFGSGELVWTPVGTDGEIGHGDAMSIHSAWKARQGEA
ncbi:hypothetical protein WMF18_28945 [Sorangium sp. So ce315]|uniref:hypothetical protein n=1 Tax=Sorangium sp. So ce315 TaxID=3133299 RepID=UPI003F5FE3D7